MAESFEDQLSRVRLMAEGDPTWDLSPNDQTALKTVLARADEAIASEILLERAVKGLKYLGQFHYPDSEAADPHSLDCTLAGRVSRVFCTGMTRSIELCRRFGENPEFNEAAERKEIESE